MFCICKHLDSLSTKKCTYEEVCSSTAGLQTACGSGSPTVSTHTHRSPEPPDLTSGGLPAALHPQACLSLPLGLRPRLVTRKPRCSVLSSLVSFKHANTCSYSSARPCRSLSRGNPFGSSPGPLPFSSPPFPRAGIGEAVWEAAHLCSPEKKIALPHFLQEGPLSNTRTRTGGAKSG